MAIDDPRLEQDKKLMTLHWNFLVDLISNRLWSQTFFTVCFPYCMAMIFCTEMAVPWPKTCISFFALLQLVSSLRSLKHNWIHQLIISILFISLLLSYYFQNFYIIHYSFPYYSTIISILFPYYFYLISPVFHYYSPIISLLFPHQLTIIFQ